MTRRFSIIFWAALALSGSLLAQSTSPLGKEGTFESKLCFSGPFTRVVVSDTERYGTYTVTGTTESDNKAFDALKMECVAAYEMRAGVWQHRGYCVFQDASGDKFHGTDTLTTEGGYKLMYVGGTGKFTGFSGEAAIGRMEDGTKPAPGMLQGCRKASTKYRMP